MKATVLTLQVAGVGLLGPGFKSWRDGAALLRDPAAWAQAPTLTPPPASLPPTERRRAGASVKAALVVAEEAVAAAAALSGITAAALPTVFTSSTGEPANCHALCEALASPGRLVSPTRFTNSVHNAAAGYWHIGAQSMQPSTSLCAFDASFGAGLLEAAVQCASTGQPLLLAAFDVPYPEPLHSARAVADIFGVALVLQPAQAGTAGRRLTLALVVGDEGGVEGGVESTDGANRAGGAVANVDANANASPAAGTGTAPVTRCAFPPFEHMRQHIPAARALPLLALLAGEAAGAVTIATQPGMALHITVDAA